MLIFKRTLIFIFSIFCLLWMRPVLSYDNQFAFKAGIGASFSEVMGMSDRSEGYWSGAWQTQVGYRFDKWEFAMTSYVQVGTIHNLQFQLNKDHISGDGKMNSILFGPLAKYYSDVTYKKSWHPYAGAGPLIAVQTLWPDRYVGANGEQYNNRYRLVYHGRGFAMAFGLEEKESAKEQHPVFCEFYYSYLQAYKVVTVEQGNFFQNEIISSEDLTQKVHQRIFMISVGATIF